MHRTLVLLTSCMAVLAACAAVSAVLPPPSTPRVRPAHRPALGPNLLKLMADSRSAATATGAAAPEGAMTAAVAGTTDPLLRLLVVRVGILDRSGKPAFAPHCDEATLKTIIWGGRYNIAGQFLDSSANRFVITNHSATKNPSRVVSVQTSQRINSVPPVWQTEAIQALATLVPDYDVYGLIMFVLPEAMSSPHTSDQNIAILDSNQIYPWFGQVAVTPGSAAQAAAYLQRAINYLIWEDWSFPAPYDLPDLETPTNNANGSLPVSWTRYSTAERWMAGWIPGRNVRYAPTTVATWRTLAGTGLVLKSSSVASVKATDTLAFVVVPGMVEYCFDCPLHYIVSFRTRPNATAGTSGYDDNLPVGWYDRVFVHYFDGEWLRPSLETVLAPGQTYSTYFGLTFRFASIDKATASARLTFCTPAVPRISTLKPARLLNGTLPPLVLKGGSCAAGKTFRGPLSVVVSNPSVGCDILFLLPPAVSSPDPDPFAGSAGYYPPGGLSITSTKDQFAGIHSGSSNTNVYDIQVYPDTQPFSLQLQYTLDASISLFDLSAPTPGPRLVYTCT